MAALSYLLACLEGEAAKGWVEPMVIIRSLAFALAFSTRFYGGMVMKTLMVPRPLPLASAFAFASASALKLSALALASASASIILLELCMALSKFIGA